MTIEIKQDADGQHWLIVEDGESIGGFKSREDAERFIKEAEEIKKNRMVGRRARQADVGNSR